MLSCFQHRQLGAGFLLGRHYLSSRIDSHFCFNRRHNSNDSGIKHIEFVNINPPSHHSHRQSISKKKSKRQGVGGGEGKNDSIIHGSQIDSGSQLQQSGYELTSPGYPWKQRTLRLAKRKHILPELLIRHIEAVTGASIKQHPVIGKNNKPLYDVEISGNTNGVNYAMQQYIQYVQVCVFCWFCFLFFWFWWKFLEISHFFSLCCYF